MGDPSSTAALDAYLANQSPSSSSTLDTKRSRLTRLRKTGSEYGPPLLGRRDSVSRSYGARLPLQDSNQQPHRHSSLRPVSQSHRDPRDVKIAKYSNPQHGEAQPGRVRAVWPPSPLDEKDETPLLEKLHPASTPRGGASAVLGTNKTSIQALQRLKRASSVKSSTPHPTGTQPISAGSRKPSHGPAEPLYPSHGAAESSRRAAKTQNAVHEDQMGSAPELPTESDATSAAAHRSFGAARQPQHGLIPAGKATADISGATMAHAAAQPAGTAAARASAPAAEPPVAQQTWRRARWDTSQDAEDARLLDSLIPLAQPTQRPHPPQQSPILAGSAGERPPQHAANAAGQHAAATVTGGVTRMPHKSDIRLPGRARAQDGTNQTGQDEAQGAASAARVLEEVLADLRAQEAGEAAASSPRSTGTETFCAHTQGLIHTSGCNAY